MKVHNVILLPDGTGYLHIEGSKKLYFDRWPQQVSALRGCNVTVLGDDLVLDEMIIGKIIGAEVVRFNENLSQEYTS